MNGAFVWACWMSWYWVCPWSTWSPNKDVTAISELRLACKGFLKRELELWSLICNLTAHLPNTAHKIKLRFWETLINIRHEQIPKSFVFWKITLDLIINSSGDGNFWPSLGQNFAFRALPSSCTSPWRLTLKCHLHLAEIRFPLYTGCGRGFGQTLYPRAAWSTSNLKCEYLLEYSIIA